MSIAKFSQFSPQFTLCRIYFRQSIFSIAMFNALFSVLYFRTMSRKVSWNFCFRCVSRQPKPLLNLLTQSISLSLWDTFLSPAWKIRHTSSLYKRLCRVLLQSIKPEAKLTEKLKAQQQRFSVSWKWHKVIKVAMTIFSLRSRNCNSVSRIQTFCEITLRRTYAVCVLRSSYWRDFPRLRSTTMLVFRLLLRRWISLVSGKRAWSKESVRLGKRSILWRCHIESWRSK